MSLSDPLALVAIVVSIGSAYVALYLQYSQRSRVAVALGEQIYLNYGEPRVTGGYSDLEAVVPVSLINRGAVDSLVTIVTATISQPAHNIRIPARWSCFLTPEDAGTPGKSSAPGWKFDGWASPLTAVSRKVTSRWILVVSLVPTETGLRPGAYSIDLTVTETRPARRRRRGHPEEGEHHAIAHWAGTFTLGQPEVDFLQDCITVNGWSANTCPVQLRRRDPRRVLPSRQLLLPR